MWPRREEVAGFLREHTDNDGNIHMNDVFAAKVRGRMRYRQNDSSPHTSHTQCAVRVHGTQRAQHALAMPVLPSLSCMFILPQVFTAKKHNMPVSFGSFNEVPLIFIKCGGDLGMDSSTYGRVPLENVLLFFNGDTPLKSNNLQSNQINFGTVSPPTKLFKMFPYFQMAAYPSHTLPDVRQRGRNELHAARASPPREAN